MRREAVGKDWLGVVGIATPQRRALRVFAQQSGDFRGIGLRHVCMCGHLIPERQPPDCFDGMGGAAPAQEFDFLIFECVRSPEKLFQLFARARRKTAYVF